MALPEPGVPLSMSDIQGEFGGSNPISLSEYYGADPSLPVSGEISIGDFYLLSSDPVEVRWCYSDTPYNDISSILYSDPSLDSHGMLFDVGGSRFVVLSTDISADKWSNVCVFDISGREHPVVSHQPPFAAFTPQYYPMLFPKTQNKWIVSWSVSQAYLSYYQYVIATFDGSSVSYTSQLQLPQEIMSGGATQRWVLLTGNKILFQVSDRKSESGTGISKVTLTVADMDDNGVLTNIGTSIEIQSAGFAAVDAIDSESFVVVHAIENGSVRVVKGTIDASNDISLGATYTSTVQSQRLLSEILTIKFGDEVRAIIDIEAPTNKVVMFNLTENPPTGVDMVEVIVSTDKYAKVANMEWDSFNSSVLIMTRKRDIQTSASTISFTCLEINANGFGAQFNKGQYTNSDAARPEPFKNGFRCRQIVTPLYRPHFFYGSLQSTIGYRMVTVGVKDFSPQPPVITSTPVTDATEGEEYYYDVNVTGSAPITFSLDVSPTGMVIDGTTGVITWTPDGTQVGDNNVDVKASNVAGHDNQPFTITVVSGSTGDPEMTTAWVTTDQHGLITYDITDPANMVEITRSDPADFGGEVSLQRITIDNGSKVGFLGHNGSCPCKIYTIDASDPSDSTTWEVGSVDVAVEDWCRQSIQYDTTNSRFYVGSGESSEPNNLFGVFNATDPSAMVHIADIDDRAAYPIVDTTRNISFTPTTGYGTDLDAMDISDPSAPVVLGTLDEGGSYKQAHGAFDYDRNLLFMAKPGTGIPVIDITDPANMVLVATLTGYDTGNDCQYDSDSKMLIVAQGGSGDFSLACFDMTDPLNAVRVGGLANSGVMGGLEIDTVRKIAFVIGGPSGSLYAVSYPDMTELSSIKIASVTPPTDPRGLALTG